MIPNIKLVSGFGDDIGYIEMDIKNRPTVIIWDARCFVTKDFEIYTEATIAYVGYTVVKRFD